MKRPPVRDDLVAMDGYHSPQVDVEIRLNTNEAPEPPPEMFMRRLLEELSRLHLNRYPDRTSSELRASLAKLHRVDPSEIFVANGSNEVLQTICLTFGGSGRVAASFEPTYAMYSQIARSTQMNVVEGLRDEHYRVSVNELDRVMETYEPAITFLCSPNNPTGTPESPELIERALERSTGLVVVDEAYGQFAKFTALDFLRAPQPAESLIVTRTFSKTWSMAGARLGYCVAPSWIIEEFDKVVLPYHVDSIKQVAGRLALDFVPEMDERVNRISAERNRIERALRDLGLVVWPSEANFVLFRSTNPLFPGNLIWEYLLDRSILVRNCSSWPLLEGCLRVTVGSPNENNRFIGALQEIIA